MIVRYVVVMHRPANGHFLRWVCFGYGRGLVRGADFVGKSLQKRIVVSVEAGLLVLLLIEYCLVRFHMAVGARDYLLLVQAPTF